MKINTVFGAVASLACTDAVTATDASLKFKLRSRQTGPPTRELVARAPSTSVPITNSFVNFDLQWYGNITVGTPGQQFTVLFDTGSNDLILTSSACTTCGNSSLFDSSKSSTFSPQPFVNVTLSFGTGGNSVPSADPIPVTGMVGTDVVRMSGLSVPQHPFLLSDNLAEALAATPGVDGIFGLGPRTAASKFTTFGNGTNTTSFPSFFWTLVEGGAIPEPIFSFYLNSGKDTPDGELTLGGTDASKYDGDLHVVDFNTSISTKGGSWFIDTPTFFVNGQAVANSESKSPFPAAQALMDTGTAYIQTPDYQTAKDIYAAISSDIHQIDQLGSWGAPCETLEKLDPDITFTIGSGEQAFNMTVPKGAFNLGPYPNQTDICQALFLNALAPLAPPVTIWVIGSPLLKGYYTVWNGTDPDNLQLSVASLKASLTTGGGSSPTASSSPSATTTPNSGKIIAASVNLMGVIAAVSTMFLL